MYGEAELTYRWTSSSACLSLWPCLRNNKCNVWYMQRCGKCNVWFLTWASLILVLKYDVRIWSYTVHVWFLGGLIRSCESYGYHVEACACSFYVYRYNTTSRHMYMIHIGPSIHTNASVWSWDDDVESIIDRIRTKHLLLWWLRATEHIIAYYSLSHIIRYIYDHMIRAYP